MENKFELLHLGIKTDDPAKAEETAKLLAMMFNLDVKMGNSSNFAGKYFECMKKENSPGTNGHIAMATQDVDAAKAELEGKGFSLRHSPGMRFCPGWYLQSSSPLFRKP